MRAWDYPHETVVIRCELQRDNQDESLASIRMRAGFWGIAGKA